jgi:hypothetical protein
MMQALFKAENVDTDNVEVGEHEDGISQELRPVFRSSPYTAEARRQLIRRKHARILIVDEGNCCRYTATTEFESAPG